MDRNCSADFGPPRIMSVRERERETERERDRERDRQTNR